MCASRHVRVNAGALVHGRREREVVYQRVLGSLCEPRVLREGAREQVGLLAVHFGLQVQFGQHAAQLVRGHRPVPHAVKVLEERVELQAALTHLSTHTTYNIHHTAYNIRTMHYAWLCIAMHVCFCVGECM